jgi:hypothetical protein
MRLKTFAVVAFIAMCLQVAAAAAPRTISEDDLQRAVTLGSPVVSPDGKTVVVQVTRIVWNDDRRESELVSIDLVTGTQRV